MVSPDEVLRFWLDEVGPKGWYQNSEALDAQVRERFSSAWENARAPDLRAHAGVWPRQPASCPRASRGDPPLWPIPLS